MAALLLFWAGILLVIAGWIVTAQWRNIAWDPTYALARLGAASIVAAWLLGRLLRCRFATAMLMVWLVALVCCAGFAPSVAVALIAATAVAIGTLIVPAGWPARAALCALTGLALMVGVAGWLLPLHFDHLRGVYVLIFMIVIPWRWCALCAILRPLPKQWSGAVAAAPVAAAITVTVLGVVSTGAWLPTILFDDLSYHIGLPAQLASLGYYQMNAGSNVWAVAAWSADVLQGIAQVVAGAESRGPVNMLWFAMSAILLWRLCEELELGSAVRWLAVALFASAAEVAYTLVSMQTEGPTTTVVFGLALLIQRNEKPDAWGLTAMAALFGLLVGLKVSNLWFALPLGLWLLWQWRFRLPWRALPAALFAAFVVAGSSYVYACVLTGNPVLPAFNGVFHSPFFAPVNYYDSRWHSGFGWDIVWNLVFHASAYIQGGTAAGAFFLVGLSGCFLLAFRRPHARGLALVAGVAFLLPLSIIQYWRYATPGMALLVPAMLCGVPGHVKSGIHARVRTAVLWLLPVASLLFVSSVCWQFRDGMLPLWLRKGDSAVVERFAPARLIAQVIQRRHGETARTLMLVRGKPFVAELAGKGFADSWYDPRLHALLKRPAAATDPAKWMQAIQLTGANLLVTERVAIPAGMQSAIAANHGTLEYAVNDLALWQLHAGSPGIATSMGGRGTLVRFATSGAPSGPTLVHGELELACNPQPVQRAPVVIVWRGVAANGRHFGRAEWMQCQPDGHAHAVFDKAVVGKVTAFTASLQPDRAAGVDFRLISSRANFRIDRTDANDLAEKLRHALEFKKQHPSPASGGAA